MDWILRHCCCCIFTVLEANDMERIAPLVNRNNTNSLFDQTHSHTDISADPNAVELVMTNSPSHSKSEFPEIEEVLQSYAKNPEYYITALLKILPSIRLQSAAINSLFIAERENMNNTNTIFLLHQLALQLSELQRKDLLLLLQGLPSAVMGDGALQSQIRVFNDVFEDNRASIMEQNSKVASALLNSVVNAIKYCLRNTNEPKDRIVVITTAIADPALLLRGMDRYRVTLQQMLLTKLLPADELKRGEILQSIFTDVS